MITTFATENGMRVSNQSFKQWIGLLSRVHNFYLGVYFHCSMSREPGDNGVVVYLETVWLLSLVKDFCN